MSTKEILQLLAVNFIITFLASFLAISLFMNVYRPLPRFVRGGHLIIPQQVPVNRYPVRVKNGVVPTAPVPNAPQAPVPMAPPTK